MSTSGTRSWALVVVILISAGGCHYVQVDEKFDSEMRTWKEVDHTLLREAMRQCHTYVDAHRPVGKVVEIDQDRGLVKFQTDKAVRVVQPSPQVLAATRVGDTISAPEKGAPSSVESCLTMLGYRSRQKLVPGIGSK